jgi:hypothetical protein
METGNRVVNWFAQRTDRTVTRRWCAAGFRDGFTAGGHESGNLGYTNDPRAGLGLSLPFPVNGWIVSGMQIRL